jgi:hypothetical protein
MLPERARRLLLGKLVGRLLGRLIYIFSMAVELVGDVCKVEKVES